MLANVLWSLRRPRGYGYFSLGALARMLQEHRAGRGEYGNYPLWVPGSSSGTAPSRGVEDRPEEPERMPW
jgi:hypothetical protein